MTSRPLTDWLIAVCILYPLSAAAVVLRLVAVRLRRAGLKMSDYLVLLSWLCQTGYVIDVSVEGLTFGGYGRHMATLTLMEYIHSLRAFWISQWLWAFGVCSFRLAVLALYMDIFRTDGFRRPVLVGTASVIVAYLVACIFTLCLLCRPITYNWDITLEDGNCGDVVALEYSSVVFNMVLDLWVVYLPLPAVWTLKLSSQKKWILTAAFSLGLGTAAANLARLIQTVQYRSEPPDPTFYFLNSTIIMFAELSSGILAACVPMLGPLLSRRGGSTTKGTPSPADGSEEGARRTIGSIPLRGYKKHKASALDESLLSTKNEPEVAGTEPVEEEATAALAPRVAYMRHDQVEVERQTDCGLFDTIGCSFGMADGMYQGNTFVRTLTYDVDGRGPIQRAVRPWEAQGGQR